MPCHTAAMARLLRPRWRVLWWAGLCWGLGGLDKNAGAAAGMLSLRDLATTGAWTSRTGWGTRLQTCPAGTSAPAGSDDASDCACAPGLTGSPCAVCSSGTFKDSLGPAACTACGVGSTSLPGARDALECLCVAGYYRLNGVCTECAAGMYKPHVGDAGCVPCPADSTSRAAAAMFSECWCDDGFTPQAGFCLRCGTDSYSGGGLDNDLSVTVNKTCAACPSFSSSPAGSVSVDDCLCVPGHK